ncbi:hypothetical protein ACFE04_002790 [Oxalis oulophora]
MAAQQQEDGWPLGLQPLNERIGIVRNRNISSASVSVSFTTLLTASSTSSSSSMDSSSSDLDTQSTGSFFVDRSITLGSLIGLPALSQLSRRSTRRRTAAETDQKKTKSWLFSLCSKLSTDAVNTNQHYNSAASLGRFLEQERRVRRVNQNSLFVEDHHVAVPHENSIRGEQLHNGHGAPLPAFSLYSKQDKTNIKMKNYSSIKSIAQYHFIFDIQKPLAESGEAESSSGMMITSSQ